MPKIHDLNELLIAEIKDLHSAESQLVKALPKMIKAAGDEQLKQAIESHLEETEGHVTRLDRAAEILGVKATGKTCQAMKGLIAEAEEVVGECVDESTRDAAIIGAAQRVEHYEMAGYGAARTYATLLGQEIVNELLQATLDEEGAANKTLTTLADSLNHAAVPSGR